MVALGLKARRIGSSKFFAKRLKAKSGGESQRNI